MTPLNSRYAIQSLSNRLTSSLQSRVVVQFIFALLLCGAVVAVYFPGLGGGFVFDDYPNIVDNTALHVSSLRWQDWMAAMFSSPASALQRPLAMLSFAVNCYFTGLDPWPMKLTGLIVHVLNTALVLVLARRLLATTAPPEASSRQREFAAYFIAAAWGLHPINLMAVLYVVQRMESLCHVFVFAGLWLYVSGRQDQLAGTGGWVRILAG
jgi:hypothetical protein